MNQETLNIGIDLDGVVVDIHPYILAWLKQELDVSLAKEEITSWKIIDHPKIIAVPNGPEKLANFFTNNVEIYHHQHSPPLPQAIETINHWQEAGHEIHFITARRSDAFTQVTHDWLISNDLEWAVEQDRVHLLPPTGETSDDFKKNLITELELQVYIDDRSETMLILQDVAGLFLKIIPSQPWNKEKDTPDSIPASDWGKIARLVGALTNIWLG
jgi:uncharacterized HAD superfamily protein